MSVITSLSNAALVSRGYTYDRHYVSRRLPARKEFETHRRALVRRVGPGMRWRVLVLRRAARRALDRLRRAAGRRRLRARRGVLSGHRRGAAPRHRRRLGSARLVLFARSQATPKPGRALRRYSNLPAQVWSFATLALPHVPARVASGPNMHALPAH